MGIPTPCPAKAPSVGPRARWPVQQPTLSPPMPRPGRAPSGATPLLRLRPSGPQGGRCECTAGSWRPNGGPAARMWLCRPRTAQDSALPGPGGCGLGSASFRFCTRPATRAASRMARMTISFEAREDGKVAARLGPLCAHPHRWPTNIQAELDGTPQRHPCARSTPASFEPVLERGSNSRTAQPPADASPKMVRSRSHTWATSTSR